MAMCLGMIRGLFTPLGAFTSSHGLRNVNELTLALAKSNIMSILSNKFNSMALTVSVGIHTRVFIFYSILISHIKSKIEDKI